MYDHTKHFGRKYFSRYCLQAFSTEEILKCQLMITSNLMVKKGLRYLKKMNMLDSNIYERKIKSPFMIYADFENILLPEINEKQTPNES